MKSFFAIIIFIIAVPFAFAENQTYPPEKDISIAINIDSEIYANVTYSNLFRITNNNHLSGITEKINVTSLYNLSLNNSEIKKEFFFNQINSYTSSNTGSFVAQKYGNYTLCGMINNSSNPDPNIENNKVCFDFSIFPSEVECNISINIITEKTVYSNSESIDFYNHLDNESFPFTIEYWIEDLFGNIVKSKTNTTNTDKKSYTPSIEDPEKTFIIKNNLLTPACKNKGFKSSEKIITVKNNITFNQNSSISIISYPDESTFGNTIYAEISAYKGDTLKKTVYAWIQDKDEKPISEKSKINLNSKYSDYEFNLPIQIKPNCDEKYDSGKYYLTVEGLGIILSEPIFISGTETSLCKIIYAEEENVDVSESEEEAKEPSKGLGYSLQNIPDKIYTNTTFPVSVNITNNDNLYHNISLWAYLYTGSKCYSDSREENIISFIINPKESVLIPINVTNNALLNKTYNLKIKIKKDSQKTDYEITNSVVLQLNPFSIPVETNNTKESVLISQTSNKSSAVTANSNQISQNLLPVGMFALNFSNQSYVYQSSQSSLLPKLIYPILILAVIGVFLLYHLKKQ